MQRQARSFGATVRWSGLVAVLLCTLPAAVEARRIDVPPPAEVWVPVGDPCSALGLQKLDREVRPFGVDDRYERRVTHRAGGYVAFDCGTAEPPGYAVVEYALPSDLGDLGSGVEVWVRRSDGTYFIIRKSALRAAYRHALAAGEDLTRFTRAVDQVGDAFHVVFSPPPPPPGRARLGGGFVVILDARRGRPRGPVRYAQ